MDSRRETLILAISTYNRNIKGHNISLPQNETDSTGRIHFNDPKYSSGDPYYQDNLFSSADAEPQAEPTSNDCNTNTITNNCSEDCDPTKDRKNKTLLKKISKYNQQLKIHTSSTCTRKPRSSNPSKSQKNNSGVPEVLQIKDRLSQFKEKLIHYNSRRFAKK